jgi:hypothetical protein
MKSIFTRVAETTVQATRLQPKPNLESEPSEFVVFGSEFRWGLGIALRMQFEIDPITME